MQIRDILEKAHRCIAFETEQEAIADESLQNLIDDLVSVQTEAKRLFSLPQQLKDAGAFAVKCVCSLHLNLAALLTKRPLPHIFLLIQSYSHFSRLLI